MSSVAYSRLETLVRLYHHRHSYKAYDAYLLIFLHALGNRAADLLALAETNAAEDEIQTHRSLLLLCATGLQEQGRNSSLLHNVYLVLKDRMPSREKLILQAHVTEEDLYDELDDMAEYNQSQWPGSIIKINEDPEAVYLKNYSNKRRAESSRVTSSVGEQSGRVDDVEGQNPAKS